MFNSNSGMSPADYAAISGNNGFGNDSSWFLWIIVILALFNNGNWGNGGVFGSGASTGSGITDGYILTSDFANIERKIDGVNNGLCDGFYAMNTGMLNGFSGIGNQITQQSIAQMQDVNALSTQLAQCCCDNKSAVADLKYTMATDTCAVNTNIGNSARDIIDNSNANYRALDARITGIEMAAKDDKIADLTAQVNTLTLAASQQAQNNYIVNALAPKLPVAAYTVPNPFTGYNAGCGCPCNYAA